MKGSHEHLSKAEIEKLDKEIENESMADFIDHAHPEHFAKEFGGGIWDIVSEEEHNASVAATQQCPAVLDRNLKNKGRSEADWLIKRQMTDEEYEAFVNLSKEKEFKDIKFGLCGGLSETPLGIKNRSNFKLQKQIIYWRRGSPPKFSDLDIWYEKNGPNDPSAKQIQALKTRLMEIFKIKDPKKVDMKYAQLHSKQKNLKECGGVFVKNGVSGNELAPWQLESFGKR